MNELAEPGVVPAHAADVAVLRAAAAGDARAVRRLLDEMAPVVYGFVFARVGGNEEAAADLVQDTLVEAVRSAHGFRGEAALTTWLCAIARRRLARHYESERRDTLVRSGLHVVGPPSEPARDDEVAGRDEVVRALGKLAPLHRQVLVLKYLDDLTVEEIAQVVGRSRVQVQSLLQRARDGLRRTLESADD
jgi:RNA polymerase sigma-70 factor (ECF subfamily)